MSNFATDRDAAEAVGLNDTVIGELLGKTRQAVNYGLQHNKAYFKDHELMTLLLYCRSRQSPRLNDLIVYIKDTREKHDEILSAFDSVKPLPNTLPPQLADAESAWVILPGYRYFNHTHSLVAQSLRTAILDFPEKFQIFTIDITESNALIADLEAGARGRGEFKKPANLDVRVLSFVNALPYMLFLKFSDKPRAAFVLVSDNAFEQIDGLRGEAIYEMLERHSTSASSRRKPSVRRLPSLTTAANQK